MGAEQDHLCAVAQASNCRGLVLCINIYIYSILLICLSLPSKCSIAACRYFWSFGRDLCDESCDAMFEICVCVCIFAKAIFHVFVQESFFFQVHSYNHHRSSPGSEHGSCLCFQVFLNCSYSHLLCCRLAVLHIHFGDGRCHVRQNTARNFTLLQSY